MAAENILKPGGFLCIVTFHSTEDRIVKNFLRWCARKRSDMFEEAAECNESFK
jgi:16S rRNA C1402 N4-methylase RsmH